MVLIGVPLDQIREVRVSAGSLGNQSFYAHDGLKRTRSFDFRNAIPVVGRVIADDPAAVRGLPVYLSTLGEDYQDLTRHLPEGEAWIVTDDQGRFRVPALATGIFFASVQVPEESLYRAPSIRDRDFKASSRIEIEIPLKRMIHVRGVVREKGTGKPIEGVGVSFSSPDQIGSAAICPYRCRTAATRPWPLRVPNPISISPSPRPISSRARASRRRSDEKDGQMLPPVELERGVTLRGIVVDEADKPVVGADVEGKWDKICPSIRPTTPDGDGPALSRRRPRRTPKVNSAGGDPSGRERDARGQRVEARTDRPNQAAAGTATPAKLVISGANTVALFGHVVDAADRAVAGALVQIRSRPLKDNGSPGARPDSLRRERDPHRPRRPVPDSSAAQARLWLSRRDQARG